MKNTISKTSAIVLLLTGSLALAEEARPKIGLALSGGGARGFAHVGVLKWFEENRIPVDYIAGTSMGGLIGGLYATGMTAQQLEEFSRQIDWAVLLRPVPPYGSLSFRRKEDRRAFPNQLELGLKGGLKVPPGLNSGHSIGLMFDRLTLPYSDISSFDELPIPFRCLSTDMVEARLVVLSRGSLASALQATMAIPGVFSPIEIDDQILASDGGLLKNIPTDTVEAMGADIVLAVNIGTPLAKKEALQSLGGVLGQTIGVMMEESTRRSLDPRLNPKLKTVIEPKLEGITTFDFSGSDKIIALGYQGAEAMADELKTYSLSEEEWSAYMEWKRSRIRTAVPVPEFLEVTGAKTAGKLIQKQLSDLVGKPISPDAMDVSLNRIWGYGQYAGLRYSVIEREGRPGLGVFVRSKGYAPPFLNLGLELNNTETDVFDFNFRARVTFFDFLSKNSEARLDASLGSRLLLGGEYYKRLRGSSFFVAPFASAEQTKTGLFEDGVQIAEYELSNTKLGADFGYELSSTSEMRIGYTIANLDGSIRIGDPVLPDVSGKQSVAALQWVLDSGDSIVLPTRGIRSTVQARWIFDTPVPETVPSDEEFGQAFARMTAFVPMGERNTLVLAGEGGTSFRYDAALFDQFTLGGLFRVSGLTRDEFRGNHVLYGALMYFRRIGNMPPLLGEKISAGVWYETGSAFNQWDDRQFYQSVSAGLIIETLLGPVFVGGSWAEGGRGNFFFAIGRFL